MISPHPRLRFLLFSPFHMASASSTRAALDGLLQAQRTKDLEEYDARENHVPMTLIALYRFGASDEKLLAYREAVTGLPKRVLTTYLPQDQLVPITSDSWDNSLGDLNLLPAFYCFFLQSIAHQGIPSTLSAFVPSLMRGIAGHAFHPLLRLGFALDVDIAEEVAISLAWWAATFRPSPPIQSNEFSPVEPEALLQSMIECDELKATPMVGNIESRISSF